MGTIIKFPADATARRRGVTMAPLVRNATAQIFILPVIRIERDIDDNEFEPGEGTAPRRRRKRRARS